MSNFLLNDNQGKSSTLQELLSMPEPRNWHLITEIGYKLSEEGRSVLVEEAVLILKRLPELSEFFPQKIHNVKCPQERCESMLPIRNIDSGVHICSCRNYHLWVSWDKEEPVVCVVRPVLSDEEQ